MRKVLAVPISNASVEAGDTKPVDDDGDGSLLEPRKDDEYSSQALSRKAEQILASAKKRLTVGCVPRHPNFHLIHFVEYGRQPK